MANAVVKVFVTILKAFHDWRDGTLESFAGAKP